ncbi:TonB-dependent receptor [Brevundimonas sp. S30B]|uniref:TonB-dependent receptor n=1 Tax=unclassified Brevundimonas TaxID=2622653 RepID=UPI001072323F|nr:MULTISPECIES: TonB-dependent receptor [unclassified Brevundimonas]QBX37047.1 TonB-dependent receptor [Brevundimonas sp. MF30-B]TFW04157.1 TonB-dependent receptor [Brevundimonas sp. S30B]
MNRLVKTALMAGAAWTALGGVAAAQSAPSDQQATTVGDIIVTARRTEESLQRTPLAISAFSGETLARQGVQQVTDIQGAVPNLNIVQGRGSSNATNIYIRGVGQPDALQTFDPAVGVYVDDVYYSRIRGTQFDLLDLERVEILRGPQGTLYGKNTIGGAMKLVSRRPDDQFRARASVSGGNYDLIDVQGAVSGPIAEGLALGLSALHSERGGYVTDPVTGAEYNDKNTSAVRAALAWDPSALVRVDLTADYSKDDAGLTVGQAQNSLTFLAGGVALPIASPPPTYDFRTRTTPGLPNETRLETWGTSARIAVDMTDALTLRSITAYRELKTDDYIDFDATQLEIADALVAVDQSQFSQEFQLTYDNGGPLTAVGGVYFLREHVSSHQESYNDDLLGPAFGNSGFLRTIDDNLKTSSRAMYANVSYAVTDALRLSAGVRGTEEKKDYFRTTSTFYSLLPAFNATYVFEPGLGRYDDTSIMLSADYQVTPDALVYARYAQGFKSGGFNGRANSAAESTQYQPETADTYEIGAKTTWLDGRLRLNGAVFHTQYEDFQARVAGLDVDPVTGLPAPVLSVLNAGELKIQGAELEAVLAVNPNFTLDAQVGYLDAEYKEFADDRFTSFGGSRAFQDPAFSPKWTARYGAQYVFDLAGGANVTLGAAAKFRSRMALAVDNTAVNSNVPLESMYQDSYWLYDARVVWNDASDRYSVGLYGQNLSDEVYKTDAQEFSSIGSIRTAYYGAPRTWMVKLTARY